MYSGGYAGKVLRINLSNKTSREEPLSEEMARDFIGRAGFGIKVLFNEVKPGVDPLGPDNKLIFAPGPFTEAGVPCASRMAVTGKSPLTGADHCRSYAFQEVFGDSIPWEVDRFAIEDKGKLTTWNQDVRTSTLDCAPMYAFLLDMAVPDTTC
jgi:aldehyde:ferredoxin oxidoreductase